MRKSVTLLLVLIGTAYPYLKSYEVQPVSAAYSGKVDGDPLHGGVGQTFVANFDSAVAV